jgi:hypothetical protein
MLVSNFSFIYYDPIKRFFEELASWKKYVEKGRNRKSDNLGTRSDRISDD